MDDGCHETLKLSLTDLGCVHTSHTSLPVKSMFPHAGHQGQKLWLENKGPTTSWSSVESTSILALYVNPMKYSLSVLTIVLVALSPKASERLPAKPARPSHPQLCGLSIAFFWKVPITLGRWVQARLVSKTFDYKCVVFLIQHHY